MSEKPIIHTDLIQNTPEWDEAHAGVITSRSAGLWVAEKPKPRLTVKQLREYLDSVKVSYKKSASKDELMDLVPDSVIEDSMDYTEGRKNAAEALIATKLAENEGWREPDISHLPHIERGLRMEAEAFEIFVEHTGLDVVKVGFITCLDGLVGDSPDGVIYHPDGSIDAVLEIKVPDGPKHFLTWMREAVPLDNIPQNHHHLAVTGARKCYFASYSEFGRMFIKEVPRSEFTLEYRAGLERLADEYREAMSREQDKWDAAVAEREGVTI